MTFYIWQSLCLLAHSHRGHKMQMDKVFCAARPVSPSAEHQTDCFQCTQSRCFSFFFLFFCEIQDRKQTLQSVLAFARALRWQHSLGAGAFSPACRKTTCGQKQQHLCRVQDDNCHAGDVADPRSILGFEHLLNT